MDYKILVDTYEALESTSKGLEKTSIISEFLSKIKNNPEYIYLLQGKVFPDWSPQELGLSEQLAIKIISKTSGIKDSEVVKKFKQTGDLGKVSEELIGNKKQSALFSTKKLTVDKVVSNLQKLSTLEGKGTVGKKVDLVTELLHSATGSEARYIIRTILGDLKVGVGSGILRDAIVQYIYNPENIEDKKLYANKIQEAYDKTTDFAEVFEKAQKNELDKISLTPGKPVKVMLYPKAHGVEDAFRIVGRPAAFEYKYDGFRVMINKSKEGEIKIFTRRLEDVSKQFPDIIKYVKTHIKAESFIVDGEAVGFNPETKQYEDFQYISQRIRRKYDIEKLIEKLPIELNLFDIIYLDGKNLIKESFEQRRKVLEKIIKQEPWKIVLAKQIITDNEKEAEKFYAKALEDKQEGVMVKGLDKVYKPGARIGYAVKLKPVDNDFDLVITGAEWGTGKRGGWLTSFDVACLGENNELLQIGKVSTGIKEKREQGLSYEELTELIKPLAIKEKGKHIEVQPKIVVAVQYQNIQKSPTYSSGYALRFPRIIRLRPDRSKSDIARISEIEDEVEN
jgi:DNA ligase-1